MELPDDILARLRVAQAGLVAVRDVFWLPAHRVRWFPGGKDRFCIVVALEEVTGGGPPLAHLIAGTTNRDTRPTTLHVPARTIDLTEDTYFIFRFTGSIATSALTVEGKPRGRLDLAWHDALDSAIRSSKLAVVKRLWT